MDKQKLYKIIGIMVLVLIAAVLVIVISTANKKPISTNQTQTSTAEDKPKAYGVSGTVTKISGDKISLKLGDGTVIEFSVQANAQIVKLVTSQGKTSMQPLKFSDIKIGNQLSVTANLNPVSIADPGVTQIIVSK